LKGAQASDLVCPICIVVWPSIAFCKKWVTCFSCRKTGHVLVHCQAQWRKTNRRSQLEPGEPSGNKAPFSQQTNLANNLGPSSTSAGASPTSPGIALELGPAMINLDPSSSDATPPPPRAPPPRDMAYQRAGPRPFVPQGFQPMELQNREMMVRAITRHRPRIHGDFAIVSIHHLPLQPLQFLAVRKIVQEFFEEHMNVCIRDVQRTHLGQALVRFIHAHDRDLLIATSHHPYGDVNFSLVRHNQGRNWRAMQFN
jgi:hypothetical protein